jgi:hypothetical protein
MKTVTNKTQRPVRVPLPRGKTLFLGPGKTGQISSKDAEHAELKRLADSGTLEILDEGARPPAGANGDERSRAAIYGPARGGGGGRRSGDR